MLGIKAVGALCLAFACLTYAAEEQPARYDFAYAVNEPATGDQKDQHETRDGDQVTGYYRTLDSDGYVRTVNYKSDAVNGFTAEVVRVPANGGATVPAKVVPVPAKVVPVPAKVVPIKIAPLPYAVTPAVAPLPSYLSPAPQYYGPSAYPYSYEPSYSYGYRPSYSYGYQPYAYSPYSPYTFNGQYASPAVLRKR